MRQCRHADLLTDHIAIREPQIDKPMFIGRQLGHIRKSTIRSVIAFLPLSSYQRSTNCLASLQYTLAGHIAKENSQNHFEHFRVVKELLLVTLMIYMMETKRQMKNAQNYFEHFPVDIRCIQCRMMGVKNNKRKDPR